MKCLDLIIMKNLAGHIPTMSDNVRCLMNGCYFQHLQLRLMHGLQMQMTFVSFNDIPCISLDYKLVPVQF